MSNGPYKRLITIKWIAAATLICFAAQESAWAAPGVASAPAIPAAMTAAAALSINQFIQQPAQLDIPFNAVTLQEVHVGTSGRLIIHIQDAHANLSGQQSLAKAVEHFATRYGLKLVLVEGADRDVTLDPIRKLAPLAEWSIIARRFLYEGIISGEEYVNLTTELPIKLRGIEYQDLYDEAVKTYAALVDRRKDILHYLYQSKVSLDRLKVRVYPQELKNYEVKKGSDDLDNGAGFAETLKGLFALLPMAEMSLAEYPSLAKLKETMDRESTLDFERANREQAQILGRLKPEDARAFAEASKRLRYSQVSQYRLTRQLLDQASERGLEASNFPELKAYAEYLERFLDIKMEQVMVEQEKLEDQVFDALLPDDDARKVRAIDRFLGLLGNAYKLQMSSHDFKMYEFNEADFPTESWLAFMNRRLADLGFFESMVPTENHLETAYGDFKKFYRLVSDRDGAFLENTQKIMLEENADAAVLIAGGYHTDHLTELLRDNGDSYIVLTPLVTDTTDQEKYEQVLLGHLKDQERRLASVRRKESGIGSAESVAATKIPRGIRPLPMAARLAAGNSGARMSTIRWLEGRVPGIFLKIVEAVRSLYDKDSGVNARDLKPAIELTDDERLIESLYDRGYAERGSLDALIDQYEFKNILKQLKQNDRLLDDIQDSFLYETVKSLFRDGEWQRLGGLVGALSFEAMITSRILREKDPVKIANKMAMLGSLFDNTWREVDADRFSVNAKLDALYPSPEDAGKFIIDQVVELTRETFIARAGGAVLLSESAIQEAVFRSVYSKFSITEIAPSLQLVRVMLRMEAAGMDRDDLASAYALEASTFNAAAKFFEDHWSEDLGYDLLTADGPDVEQAFLKLDRQAGGSSRWVTFTAYEIASLKAIKSLLNLIPLSRERVAVNPVQEIDQVTAEDWLGDVASRVMKSGDEHPDPQFPLEVSFFDWSGNPTREGPRLKIPYEHFKYAGVTPLPGTDREAVLERIFGAGPRRPVWIAASPDPAEARKVLKAYRDYRTQYPDSKPLLIMGLRNHQDHPDISRDEVAGLYPEAGIGTRSSTDTNQPGLDGFNGKTDDDRPMADSDIVLMTTRGEFPRWIIPVADVAIVGAGGEYGRDLMEHAVQGVNPLYFEGAWRSNLHMKNYLTERKAAYPMTTDDILPDILTAIRDGSDRSARSTAAYREYEGRMMPAYRIFTSLYLAGMGAFVETNRQKKAVASAQAGARLGNSITGTRPTPEFERKQEARRRLAPLLIINPNDFIQYVSVLGGGKPGVFGNASEEEYQRILGEQSSLDELGLTVIGGRPFDAGQAQRRPTIILTSPGVATPAATAKRERPYALVDLAAFSDHVGKLTALIGSLDDKNDFIRRLEDGAMYSRLVEISDETDAGARDAASRQLIEDSINAREGIRGADRDLIIGLMLGYPILSVLYFSQQFTLQNSGSAFSSTRNIQMSLRGIAPEQVDWLTAKDVISEIRAQGLTSRAMSPFDFGVSPANDKEELIGLLRKWRSGLSAAMSAALEAQGQFVDRSQRDAIMSVILSDYPNAGARLAKLTPQGRSYAERIGERYEKLRQPGGYVEPVLPEYATAWAVTLTPNDGTPAQRRILDTGIVSYTNESGWTYRRPQQLGEHASHVASLHLEAGPTDPAKRSMDPEFFAALDVLADRYQFFYKYPAKPEEWARRKDTIVVYLPQGALERAETIAGELARVVARFRYLRGSDEGDSIGRKMEPGIYLSPKPTDFEIAQLIEFARRTNRSGDLAAAVESELSRNWEFKASPGMYEAAKQVVASIAAEKTLPKDIGSLGTQLAAARLAQRSSPTAELRNEALDDVLKRIQSNYVDLKENDQAAADAELTSVARGILSLHDVKKREDLQKALLAEVGRGSKDRESLEKRISEILEFWNPLNARHNASLNAIAVGSGASQSQILSWDYNFVTASINGIANDPELLDGRISDLIEAYVYWKTANALVYAHVKSSSGERVEAWGRLKRDIKAALEFNQWAQIFSVQPFYEAVFSLNEPELYARQNSIIEQRIASLDGLPGDDKWQSAAQTILRSAATDTLAVSEHLRRLVTTYGSDGNAVLGTYQSTHPKASYTNGVDYSLLLQHFMFLAHVYEKYWDRLNDESRSALLAGFAGFFTAHPDLLLSPNELSSMKEHHPGELGLGKQQDLESQSHFPQDDQTLLSRYSEFINENGRKLADLIEPYQDAGLDEALTGSPLGAHSTFRLDVLIALFYINLYRAPGAEPRTHKMYWDPSSILDRSNEDLYREVAEEFRSDQPKDRFAQYQFSQVLAHAINLLKEGGHTFQTSRAEFKIPSLLPGVGSPERTDEKAAARLAGSDQPALALDPDRAVRTMEGAAEDRREGGLENFRSAIEYFNRAVAGKRLTAENSVILRAIFLGLSADGSGSHTALSDEEVLRTQAQILSLFKTDKRLRRIIRRANSIKYLAKYRRSSVIKAAAQIYKDFVKQEMMSFYKDGQHTINNGHHRLAWFMMNVYLIRNGYTPFYFEDISSYRKNHVALLDGFEEDLLGSDVRLRSSAQREDGDSGARMATIIHGERIDIMNHLGPGMEPRAEVLLNQFQATQIKLTNFLLDDLISKNNQLKGIKNKNMKILLVGGTASELEYLAPRYPNATFVVVSLDRGALENIDQELNPSILSENRIELHLADLTRLGDEFAAPGSFGMVMAYGLDQSAFAEAGLYPALLNKIRSLVSPGGYALIPDAHDQAIIQDWAGNGFRTDLGLTGFYQKGATPEGGSDSLSSGARMANKDAWKVAGIATNEEIGAEIERRQQLVIDQLTSMGANESTIQSLTGVLNTVKAIYSKQGLAASPNYHNHLHNLLVVHQALIMHELDSPYSAQAAEERGLELQQELFLVATAGLLHDFRIEGAPQSGRDYTPADVTTTLAQLKQILQLEVTDRDTKSLFDISKPVAAASHPLFEDSKFSKDKLALGRNLQDAAEALFGDTLSYWKQLEPLVRRTDFPSDTTPIKSALFNRMERKGVTAIRNGARRSIGKSGSLGSVNKLLSQNRASVVAQINTYKPGRRTGGQRAGFVKRVNQVRYRIGRVLGIEERYYQSLARAPQDQQIRLDRLAKNLERADQLSYYLLLSPSAAEQVVTFLRAEGLKFASVDGTFPFFVEPQLLNEDVLAVIGRLPTALKNNFVDVVIHFVAQSKGSANRLFSQHPSVLNFSESDLRRKLGLSGSTPAPAPAIITPKKTSTRPSGSQSQPHRLLAGRLLEGVVRVVKIGGETFHVMVSALDSSSGTVYQNIHTFAAEFAGTTDTLVGKINQVAFTAKIPGADTSGANLVRTATLEETIAVYAGRHKDVDATDLRKLAQTARGIREDQTVVIGLDEELYAKLGADALKRFSDKLAGFNESGAVHVHFVPYKAGGESQVGDGYPGAQVMVFSSLASVKSADPGRFVGRGLLGYEADGVSYPNMAKVIPFLARLALTKHAVDMDGTGVRNLFGGRSPGRDALEAMKYVKESGQLTLIIDHAIPSDLAGVELEGVFLSMIEASWAA